MNWLSLGDKNTSLFHSFATQRRKINIIGVLQQGGGRVTTEEENMKQVAYLYFQKLFTTSGTMTTEQ